MGDFFQNLRKRPEAERQSIAFFAAGIFTLIITVVAYTNIFPDGTVRVVNSEAPENTTPSPFEEIGSTVRGYLGEAQSQLTEFEEMAERADDGDGVAPKIIEEEAEAPLAVPPPPPGFEREFGGEDAL